MTTSQVDNTSKLVAAQAAAATVAYFARTSAKWAANSSVDSIAIVCDDTVVVIVPDNNGASITIQNNWSKCSGHIDASNDIAAMVETMLNMVH